MTSTDIQECEIRTALSVIDEMLDLEDPKNAGLEHWREEAKWYEDKPVEIDILDNFRDVYEGFVSDLQIQFDRLKDAL